MDKDKLYFCVLTGKQMNYLFEKLNLTTFQGLEFPILGNLLQTLDSAQVIDTAALEEIQEKLKALNSVMSDQKN